jgi:hypothetical protein
MWRALLLVLLLVALPGCGSADSSPSSSDPAAPAPSAPAPSTAAPAPELVGRWQQVHDCPTLVAALDDAGLGKIAPAMIGDYFPQSPPQQLAKKSDPCAGAKPQKHAHFFTVQGMFGSLDQHDQQVDDGPYTILDDHHVQIGDGVFTYTIKNGDTLILRPVITDAAMAEALANPREFSLAGWEVAVTYDGQKWKRVDCEGWC